MMMQTMWPNMKMTTTTRRQPPYPPRLLLPPPPRRLYNHPHPHPHHHHHQAQAPPACGAWGGHPMVVYDAEQDCIEDALLVHDEGQDAVESLVSLDDEQMLQGLDYRYAGAFRGGRAYMHSVKLVYEEEEEEGCDDRSGDLVDAAGKVRAVSYVVQEGDPETAYPDGCTHVRQDTDHALQAIRMTAGRGGENFVAASVRGEFASQTTAPEWTIERCEACSRCTTTTTTTTTGDDDDGVSGGRHPDPRRCAEMRAAWAKRFPGSVAEWVPTHYTPSPDDDDWVGPETLVIWHSQHYNCIVVVTWARGVGPRNRRQAVADHIGAVWAKHYNMQAERHVATAACMRGRGD